MTKTKDLQTRINEAIDAAAEDIVWLLCDDGAFHKPSHAHRNFRLLALEMTGVTAVRLTWLSENDDNNPQYTLYYANLSTLCMKAAARACVKLAYYAPLHR